MNTPLKNESRERLLHAALRCFAQYGYEKTSTRMIAKAAQANVAAIRYYFGDKAGIYRASFHEPMGEHTPGEDVELLDKANNIQEALHGLYANFLEPLKYGELTQLSIKLHMREMIEPTGVWQQELDQGIAPSHRALVRALCRHLDIQEEDDEIHRLALCIVAQAIFLYVGQDVIQAVRPQLMALDALDDMAQRLTQYALDMVQAEQQRRKNKSKGTQK